MLLELLSDFQISIPEMGRIEAQTMPLVLLTSNNTRELTEALKRRCLYLWLDYPDLEHELEIVRLHAPELDENVARRLVEVIAMVRDLDLKKPPSIAESIDWARALLLLGATRHRRADLPRHDVDHRQAPHRPGRRDRARRRQARAGRGQPRCRLCGLRGRAMTSLRPETPRGSSRRAAIFGGTQHDAVPDGLAAHILEFAEELRGEGVAVGTSELLDSFAALPEVEWTEPGPVPRGAGDDARQVARRPARLRPRVRPLLLPRRRAGRRSRRACARATAAAMDEAGAELNLETLRAPDRPGDRRRQRERPARPRAPRDRGLRPAGRGLGRDRRRRAAHPPPARPALRRAAAAPRARPAPRRPAARRHPPLRAAAAARARAPPDRAHRGAAAGTPAERARPRAADGPASGPRERPPRRRAAQAPAEDAGQREQGPQAPRARRHAPHDARLAGDRRRARRPQVPAGPPAPARALRALRRLDERHERVGLLPVGDARAARLVPQDALVRLHRADQRGHRRLPQGARLQGRQRGDRPRTPASPTSAATPTTAASGASSASRSRTSFTRARR